MLQENTVKNGAFAVPRHEDSGNQSIEYVVDTESKLVRVKFGKRLAFADIERYAKLLQMNPSFQPAYSEIVDLRDVEEIDLQVDEFLKLADKIDPFSPEAKRSFLVQTPLQSHAASMHKVLRTKRNIEIFETADEAERWIGT